MPLVNRAPIDPVTGKLLVTTTTPTAAWPSLGGMTYHPTTGELAVKDAVPAANDPWVGGFRFTNLGSMYVTTTLPSPLWYVGGLPVSTDGRLFMSSGPPVGSVGGWPIAGDGGIAGSGLQAVPIFWAPLLTTLVPTVAGNPVFTFTRATSAYVADNEGVLRQSIAGEARFHGARRVRNWVVSNSGNMTIGGWVPASCTPTFGATGPTGLADANTITATANNAIFYNSMAMPTGVQAVCSIWMRRRTGVGAVGIRGAGNATIFVTAQIDGTWRRFSTLQTSAGGGICGVDISVSGDAIDVAYGQAEIVDGQSNQAPSEYVSVGVLAAPYHGNAVDGIKYFATTNGNSVAGNVVTEAVGTLIPVATMLGYVAENAATNLCLQSQTFDNASWGKQNGVIAANDATVAAPDGTLTADRFTDDVVNTYHRLFHQPFSFAAAAYTASVYLKSGTLPWAQINIQHTAGGVFSWANFNLTTGVVGNKAAGVTATVVALPNGWYRCSVTVTAGVDAGGYVLICGITTDQNAANPIYVGTGQTMYLWGAQVEQASDPSSYIPTTTAAVTRNVDVLRYLITANFNLALGTSYAECYFSVPSLSSQVSIGFTGPAYAVQIYDTRLNLYSPAGIFPTVNSRVIGSNKGATAWSGAIASACLNGGAAATSAFTAWPNAGPFDVGGGYDGAALKGSIRNVKFYNVRIADAELVTMTAP